MASQPYRSKHGITFHSPFAFWLGAASTTTGVLLHLPLLWSARHDGYRLAGRSPDGPMWFGVLLVVAGVTLVMYGLTPRGAFSRHGNEGPKLRVKAMDDARLTAEHYKLMAVLCVAIAVDTLKPFTFTFILHGVAQEYNLRAPDHPAPGHLPVAIFPFVAIAGTAIGSILWGHLGDRIGRRASILLASVVFMATAICSAMPAYGANVFMCFLMGLGAGGLLPIAYSLLSEITPARRRGGVVVLIAGVGTALGFLAASNLADLLIPHFGWRIMWFLNLPTGALLLGLNHYIPESPRFLVANGHEEEAKVVMRRFGAQIVDQPPTAELIAEHKAFHDSNLSMIFRKPFSGVTASIVLYGVGWGLVTYGFVVWLPLNLDKANLSAHSVTGVLAKASYFSLPAAVIVAYLYDRWSTKKTMVLFAGLTGLSLLAFAIEGDRLATHTGVLTFLVVFVLISVGGIIAVLSPYSSEVYPTRIRASGAGVAAGASKLGGVMALALSVFAIAPPSIRGSALLVGVPVVLSAVVMWFLGIETRGRRLEEIAASEVMGSGPAEPTVASYHPNVPTYGDGAVSVDGAMDVDGLPSTEGAGR